MVVRTQCRYKAAHRKQQDANCIDAKMTKLDVAKSYFLQFQIGKRDENKEKNLANVQF